MSSNSQRMAQGFSVKGSTGLVRVGGNVHEDFLPQLRYPRAAKVYKEMETNDSTINAVLLAAEQLTRRAGWRVEAAGNTPEDLRAKLFLEQCMNDMNQPWMSFITEALSMLPYGFSVHEITYKKRDGVNSKHNDGAIGWASLEGRSQASISRWLFNDDGSIAGCVQSAAPNYREVELPWNKILLFRTKESRGNPEGRSVLRGAYRAFYFKKRIEEIEAIGIERDLNGYPVLVPPAEVNLFNDLDERDLKIRHYAEELITGIRRDSDEGVILPNGWTLTLLSTQSRRQFDTTVIINRYDQRIALAVLADIVLLGADKVGSFALADVKKSMFAAALEAWLHAIADTINDYGVRRLFELNAFSVNEYPKLVPGEIESPDLEDLAKYIQVLSGIEGIELFPDNDLENALRLAASLPTRQME